MFFLILLIAPRVAGQILTENAGVTSPQTPTLREVLVIRDFDELFDLRLENQLFVGLNPKTELKVNVPWVLQRRADFTGAGGLVHTDTVSGLGDISLRLKRSLYQVDDVMESTRFAILGEAWAPTGNHDERDAGVRLPRKLQLGTGGWGLGSGAAFTLIRDRHRFSTDARFRYNTRHDGVRIGPTTRLAAAYWYRSFPPRFDPDQRQVEIRTVLEMVGTYQFESQAAQGLGDDGYRIVVAPGIQVYPRDDLLFEASLQLPVAQDIDDPRGDARWGLLVAMKILF